MGFSNYVIEETLRSIKDNCWVGLAFNNPEVAGAYASEISGSGYGRLQAHWGLISNRTMWCDQALRWNGLSQTRVTHVVGWNAEYRGDYLWSAPLDDPARILDGKGYNIPADSIALSFG